MTVRFHLADIDLRTPGPWPLNQDGTHYLSRVHRLREGDLIIVFDGAGLERQARILRVEDALYLTPEGALVKGLAGAPVTVCYGLPKGEKLDRVARQLTELGVRHLTLVRCDRSVTKLTDDRAEKKRARLKKIIAEAARQSGRSDAMTISGPMGVSDTLSDTKDQTVLVFDPTGTHGIEQLQMTGAVTLYVGPEGGFSPSELSQLALAGAHRARLGDLVLRTETAAPVAAALVLHRMGYL
jgi:16S rRNA (uracil1498-N3)-methyltransferase